MPLFDASSERVSAFKLLTISANEAKKAIFKYLIIFIFIIFINQL